MKLKFTYFNVLPLLFLISPMGGCGYHMRGAERPFFKAHDLKTLYVHPVRNNSYKAGIEITVYNAIRKRFAQGGYVKLVDRPGDADASIQATVSEASYSPMAVTTADKLAYEGTQKGPSTIQIASSYQVSLKVSFVLVDRMNKELWQDGVSRNKSFPASTYMGTLGSTSALINEGEFERTLSDLSVNIATDAEESINSIF
jgi:hypothetical protein